MVLTAVLVVVVAVLVVLEVVGQTGREMLVGLEALPAVVTIKALARVAAGQEVPDQMLLLRQEEQVVSG